MGQLQCVFGSVLFDSWKKACWLAQDNFLYISFRAQSAEFSSMPAAVLFPAFPSLPNNTHLWTKSPKSPFDPPSPPVFGRVPSPRLPRLPGNLSHVDSLAQTRRGKSTRPRDTAQPLADRLHLPLQMPCDKAASGGCAESANAAWNWCIAFWGLNVQLTIYCNMD